MYAKISNFVNFRGNLCVPIFNIIHKNSNKLTAIRTIGICIVRRNELFSLNFLGSFSAKELKTGFRPTEQDTVLDLEERSDDLPALMVWCDVVAKSEVFALFLLMILVA